MGGFDSNPGHFLCVPLPALCLSFPVSSILSKIIIMKANNDSLNKERGDVLSL